MDGDFLGVGRGRGGGRGLLQPNPAFWNEDVVAPGGAGGPGGGPARPHPYFERDVASPLPRVREARESRESTARDVVSPAALRREVEDNSPGYRSRGRGVAYSYADQHSDDDDDYPPGFRPGEYDDLLGTGPPGPFPHNSEAPRVWSEPEGNPIPTRGAWRPEQPALAKSNPIPAGGSILALPPGAKTGWGPDAWTAPGPGMTTDGPRIGPSNASSTTKRKKVNGYLLYCKRRRSEIERDTGTKVSEPLPQLLSRFDTEWKEMTEDQKDVWKERAKEQSGRS